MRLIERTVLVLALALSTAGAVLASPGDELTGTRWRLTAIGDEPALANPEVTLEFREGGRAGGSSGCNTYGGAYRADGRTVSFSELVSTKRACANEAANVQETTFLQAIGAATSYAVRGDTLTVYFEAGSLTFLRH